MPDDRAVPGAVPGHWPPWGCQGTGAPLDLPVGDGTLAVTFCGMFIASTVLGHPSVTIRMGRVSLSLSTSCSSSVPLGLSCATAESQEWLDFVENWLFLAGSPGEVLVHSSEGHWGAVRVAEAVLCPPLCSGMQFSLCPA